MDAIESFLETPSNEKRNPPLRGMILQSVENFDTYDALSGRYDTLDINFANAITSMTIFDEELEILRPPAIEDTIHKPVLDVDKPIEATDYFLLLSLISNHVPHKNPSDIDLLIYPSSTEGHFHVYVDENIYHAAYMSLLESLAYFDIIEKNYARASIARGFTALRLPWIKKEA